jgi:hypothetical protein
MGLGYWFLDGTNQKWALTFHQLSTRGLAAAMIINPKVRIRKPHTIASSLYESLAGRLISHKDQ